MRRKFKKWHSCESVSRVSAAGYIGKRTRFGRFVISLDTAAEIDAEATLSVDVETGLETGTECAGGFSSRKSGLLIEALLLAL